MKDTGGCCFILLCAAFIFCCFGLINSVLVRQEAIRDAYPAWVQLTGRKDISYEQWLALKNSGTLGQIQTVKIQEK